MALSSMVIGHFGRHDLIWTHEPISTFAARAPLDLFVTAAMLISALTLVVVSLAAVEASAGLPLLRPVIPVLSGMAAGGLFLVAAFEETISARLSVAPPTPEQIRMQAFHDAGLLLFYGGSLLLLGLLGLLWLATRSGRFRYVAVVPILSALGMLSASQWPVIPAGWTGLSQRISLLFFWIGLATVAFLYLRPLPVVKQKEDEGVIAGGISSERNIR